jgi:3-hydroxymyristoyl/3-hydroxydecanoyl-(acyl carrier protein) dehydratase
MHTLTLKISPHHAAFDGHFPGTPLVPGAVLLDETVQMIAAAANKDDCACEIMSAKFVSFVRPGESLNVEHEQRTDGSVCFVIRAPDRTVASGTLAWLPAQKRAARET